MITARVRAQIAEWVVIVAVIGATLALGGCAAVVNALPDRGPISANLAEDYARLAAGAASSSASSPSDAAGSAGSARARGPLPERDQIRP